MMVSEMLVNEEMPGRARVLLVDDRQDNLIALEAALEPLGLDLLCATSGEEALHHLLDRDVSTIVLDVQMPDMDGFETAVLVKSRAATRDIPIIFLTAISHDVERQLLGYDVGASDYVCKPVEPAILRAKVRSFVDLAARARAAEALNRELEVVVGELQERVRELEARGVRDASSGAGDAAMERILEVGFAAEAHAPAAIRAAVRTALAGQPEEVLDRVVLVVSELVVNAVTHAGSDGQVLLDVGSRGVRGEVWDHGGALSRQFLAAKRAEHGRGLFLVTQLADRCGWMHAPSGKAMWFEIDASRGPT